MITNFYGYQVLKILVMKRRLLAAQDIRTKNLPLRPAALRAFAIHHPRILISATADDAAARALRAFVE